jgi:hypothetical protein
MVEEKWVTVSLDNNLLNPSDFFNKFPELAEKAKIGPNLSDRKFCMTVYTKLTFGELMRGVKEIIKENFTH